MLALVSALSVAPTIGSAQATAAKRADVEMKGSHVMPFSQTDTMHMFQPTKMGGVQTVMVKDGAPKQIALVRAHLRKEAVAFARGDYRDPLQSTVWTCLVCPRCTLAQSTLAFGTPTCQTVRPSRMPAPTQD